MHVIIDTHIFIFREYENTLPKKLQVLLATLNELGVKIFAHPVSLKEIEFDANIKNPNVILSKLTVYPVISDPPDANTDDSFLDIVGTPNNLRDDADNQILYCIYKNTADLLITEDLGIIAKSQTIGIPDRVFSVDNALDYFKKQDAAIKVNATRTGRHTFCFFRMGEYWEIGVPFKSKKLKNSKGLEFIHFLLKHSDKQLSPVDVYYLGKSPQTYSDHISNDIGIRNLDPYELKERRSQLKQYEKIMAEKNYEGPEDVVWFEREIRRLKGEINHAQERDSHSIHEKCRVNVYRRMDLVLKNIHKYIPEMASFLNKTTIQTGDIICYKPIENNRPHWILQEKDLPAENCR